MTPTLERSKSSHERKPSRFPVPPTSSADTILDDLYSQTDAAGNPRRFNTTTDSYGVDEGGMFRPRASLRMDGRTYSYDLSEAQGWTVQAEARPAREKTKVKKPVKRGFSKVLYGIFLGLAIVMTPALISQKEGTDPKAAQFQSPAMAMVLPSISKEPYRTFSGKELDEETGLYYFGARYYDPRTSVWQSPDPALGKFLPNAGFDNGLKFKGVPDWNWEIGLLGGGGVYNSLNLNLYSYVHQNPLKLIDPDGKFPFDVTILSATRPQAPGDEYNPMADVNLHMGIGMGESEDYAVAYMGKAAGNEVMNDPKISLALSLTPIGPSAKVFSTALKAEQYGTAAVAGVAYLGATLGAVKSTLDIEGVKLSKGVNRAFASIGAFADTVGLATAKNLKDVGTSLYGLYGDVKGLAEGAGAESKKKLSLRQLN